MSKRRIRPPYVSASNGAECFARALDTNPPGHWSRAFVDHPAAHVLAKSGRGAAAKERRGWRATGVSSPPPFQDHGQRITSNVTPTLQAATLQSQGSRDVGRVVMI